MTVSKMISADEFTQMSKFNVYAKNKQEQQSIKRILLASVQDAYGETYYRLKKGTRKAIDMMCWFSAERGFFFASDGYFAERYDVSGKTIRNIAKKLRDDGLIITLYRRSSTQNGRSAPLHLFVDHPYFSQWKSFLKLDDCQADCQAEINENPCGSKDEEGKNVATNYLNLNKSFKNIRKEYPVLDESFTPTHIPKMFISAVKPFFGEATSIYRLWGKAMLAYQKSLLTAPLETVGSVVIQAFKESVFAHKHGRIKTTFEAYFFGTLRNMFTVEKRKEVFENHPVFFNFLEDH